jgi:hypothetical protein
MGGRWRFLKATLAALAALGLLAGIGVGVWVASSDEDAPPAALALAPPEPEAEAPGDQPAPAEPTEEQPPASEEPPPPAATETAPQAISEAPATPEPQAPSGAEPDTTRFPRERRKDPDRRGKRFLVPPAREFTGTGNALIGTVDVRQPALVKWTARGRFGLEFGQEAFPIIAPSRSGQLVVPPYRFELVRVLAKGRWTITVTPQR